MTKYITLATEDELSESVATKLVRTYTNFSISQSLRKGGNGYLRSRLENFFRLSEQMPVLLITDLDLGLCAPSLINEWKKGIHVEQPGNMLFRVAVRETESWLLADHENIAPYLNANNIPDDVDALQDPKQTLLALAKKAPRDIRLGILAQRGAVAIQGLEYNLRLGTFVDEQWSPENARVRSSSLNKACDRLCELDARTTT